VGLQWTEVGLAVPPALPAADVVALALAPPAGCRLSHFFTVAEEHFVSFFLICLICLIYSICLFRSQCLYQ
jgi:hypothetical protein